MSTPSSNIAFTPAVKAIQARRGSRETYERLEQRGGFRTLITPELASFIAGLDSVYLGTASADGQPYLSLRSVVNGLEFGCAGRSLRDALLRRVPTRWGNAGRLSRRRGSSWGLGCRAF